MPFIVVTRLRLRDSAFFDEFFASAVAVVEQATNSEGNLGADVLAEANNTFWTRTAWKERGLMHASPWPPVRYGPPDELTGQTTKSPEVRGS